MPRCNSEAMSLHLGEIAFHVAPGAHAVLILDQAGWHGSAELVVPDNITFLPLPPRCPELNPVENVWQFMRDNWLGGGDYGGRFSGNYDGRYARPSGLIAGRGEAPTGERA